jgi:NAD(P)-dependent dehydrogenase (short-subunit alcohol dehydrogenase family)
MNAISRVAVITGAGRGIGLGLARLLAELGVAVVINDSGVALDGSASDSELAERVASQIAKDGGRAVWNTQSIADPATGEQLVALAQTAFGRLDAWVNAAAITSDRMLFNMTDDAWSNVVETNLSGTFYCMRAALRHFKQARAGRLLNLVSTSGLIGNIGQANYAASKAGMVALARVAALEMVRYGVAVNCVAPFACTRMTESIQGTTPEQRAYLERARRATVEQIVPFLAYLLLSEAAAGISGQVFGVRGTEVFLFSQPRVVCTIGQAGGWTLDSLERAVDSALRPWLVPLQTDLELFQYEPLI